MRRPWRAASVESLDGEGNDRRTRNRDSAQAQAEQAGQLLAGELKRRPEVERIAAAHRRMREENHFGNLIQQALGG